MPKVAETSSKNPGSIKDLVSKSGKTSSDILQNPARSNIGLSSQSAKVAETLHKLCDPKINGSKPVPVKTQGKARGCLPTLFKQKSHRPKSGQTSLYIPRKVRKNAMPNFENDKSTSDIPRNLRASKKLQIQKHEKTRRKNLPPHPPRGVGLEPKALLKHKENPGPTPLPGI